MEKLGILGGMGPMATAYFLEVLIAHTQAEKDQDHVEIRLAHCPSIPDRTNYLLGKGPSPLPDMIRAGRGLVAEQVRMIAVPCVTASFFKKELEQALQVEVRHGTEELAGELVAKNCRCVGIMATSGTVQAGLFNTLLQETGIKVVYPSEQNQELLQELIYGEIKSGKKPDAAKFRKISENLFSQGAESIVLGCTELSLYQKYNPLDERYVDVTHLLAESVLKSFGKWKE